MKNILMLGLLAFWGTTMAHSAEEQSAFVSCMEIKVKEIFQPPDSVMPMMRLQAQITEREYEKIVGTLNKSPEDLADLEENRQLKEELHWLKVENSGLKQTNAWWSKAAQR